MAYLKFTNNTATASNGIPANSAGIIPGGGFKTNNLGQINEVSIPGQHAGLLGLALGDTEVAVSSTATAGRKAIYDPFIFGGEALLVGSYSGAEDASGAAEIAASKLSVKAGDPNAIFRARKSDGTEWDIADITAEMITDVAQTPLYAFNAGKTEVTKLGYLTGGRYSGYGGPTSTVKFFVHLVDGYSAAKWDDIVEPGSVIARRVTRTAVASSDGLWEAYDNNGGLLASNHS